MEILEFKNTIKILQMGLTANLRCQRQTFWISKQNNSNCVTSKTKEKLLEEKWKNFRDMWHNIEHSTAHESGVPEEGRERAAENYLMAKTSPTYYRATTFRFKKLNKSHVGKIQRKSIIDPSQSRRWKLRYNIKSKIKLKQNI